MATTPATDAAEITSRILLEMKSVLFSPEQPFTFTSGRRSPVYIDCRRLISFPRGRRHDPDGWSAARGGGRSSASSSS
jgi:orotate phosphoribosyltransferase